jgi:hypothetical protein
MTTWCIPEAIGVPYLWGQPPTWPGIDALNGLPAWTPAKTDPTWELSPKGLDDPRWQGHLAIGYPSMSPLQTPCCTPGTGVAPGIGDGSQEDVLFRTLYDQSGAQKHLYLSWWVKASEAATGSGVTDDVLYLGLARATADPLVLRLSPSASTGTVYAGPIGSVTLYTLPSGGTTLVESTGTTPAWITANTHVWVDQDKRRWALQMRIPIGSGNVSTHLDLADTFRMWFEVAIELPSGLVAPYSWPRNACVVSECGALGDLKVPALSLWETFHFSSGPADPACSTTGLVRLSSDDIGTQNVPTTKINLVSDNVFAAKPLNLKDTPVDAGQIKAEFRIADWGSTADPIAPWTLVPATPDPATAQPTHNPATGSGTIQPGAKGSIGFHWKLNDTERGVYSQDAKKHQCILVTLSGPYEFNPASTWQNMNFAQASSIARDATISNFGLGPSPTPGAARTAYILVEKLSMPELVEDTGRGGEPGPVVEAEERPEPGPVIEAAGRPELGLEEGTDPHVVLAQAADVYADPIDRHERGPTIRYHVYHDTGLDVTRDGRTLRVVRPGTAFGFFVEHTGPLSGWRDEIVGATKITDRFYRLDVPEEGTAKITTIVEAREVMLPKGCFRLLNLLPRRWRDAVIRLIARLKGIFGS